MIDYKGGKIVWDTSSDWELDEKEYAFAQDILQMSYPVPQGKLIIDVGSYMGWDNKNAVFVICVALLEDNKTDDEHAAAWDRPITRILCIDKQDMLLQLQRAIDTYPKMMRRTILT